MRRRQAAAGPSSDIRLGGRLRPPSDGRRAPCGALLPASPPKRGCAGAAGARGGTCLRVTAWVLVLAGVLAGAVAGAGGATPPALPSGVPAADRARIEKVLAQATVTT